MPEIEEKETKEKEVKVAGFEVPEEVPEIEEKAAKTDTYEQKARDMGWVPEDDYEGDKDEWIDAKEFVKREPLFKKIKDKSTRIKTLEHKMDKQGIIVKEMISHIHDVESIARERAIRELKKDYKTAVRDEDEAKASEIDKEMDKLREPRPAPEDKVAQEQTPEFIAWLDNNAWYSENTDMKEFADAFGATLTKRGVYGDEMLGKVADAVKKAYSDKFTNPRRAEPSTVEGVKGKAPSKTKYSRSDLSPDQKLVHDAFVDGGMDSQTYIGQMVERGKLGSK